MIRTGSTNEIITSTPETVSAFEEKYARELGLKGLSASVNEEDVVGYPADVDEKGDYIITPEVTEVPSKKLNPGDIGYNAALDGDTAKTYHIPGSDKPGSAGARNS